MPARAEPSSDLRQAAHEARQIFLAFVESGFTETQAMDLTKAWLSSLIQRGTGSAD